MTIATTAYIQGAGQVPIFQSTAAGAGDWYPVHPGLRNLTFQATMTGSSVGASVSGTVEIQASNDGVNPLATALGTITLSSAASPGSDGLAIDAHWNYVRAKLTTGSTNSSGSSMAVIVSAHVP